MKMLKQENYTIYRIRLIEPYFTFVKNGKKTIEGRLKKGKYRFIKPGDHIIVYNSEETDSVEVLVKEVRTYTSIREMLNKETVKKVLPNIKTVEQGLGLYKQFYTDKQEKEFGVVAIEVDRIK